MVTITYSAWLTATQSLLGVKNLKQNLGVEVKKAFEKILNNGRTPDKIQYDKCKEFYNEKVKNLFKE